MNVKIVCGDMPTDINFEFVPSTDNNAEEAVIGGKKMAFFLYHHSTWKFAEAVVLQYLKMTDDKSYQFVLDRMKNRDFS